jgi:hypothetical protein
MHPNQHSSSKSKPSVVLSLPPTSFCSPSSDDDNKTLITPLQDPDKLPHLLPVKALPARKYGLAPQYHPATAMFLATNSGPHHHKHHQRKWSAPPLGGLRRKR